MARRRSPTTGGDAQGVDPLLTRNVDDAGQRIEELLASFPTPPRREADERVLEVNVGDVEKPHESLRWVVFRPATPG